MTSLVMDNPIVVEHLEVYEIWSEQQLDAPEINYSANSFSFVKGVPIQTIVPVNEGVEKFHFGQFTLRQSQNFQMDYNFHLPRVL